MPTAKGQPKNIAYANVLSSMLMREPNFATLSAANRYFVLPNSTARPVKTAPQMPRPPPPPLPGIRLEKPLEEPPPPRLSRPDFSFRLRVTPSPRRRTRL